MIAWFRQPLIHIATREIRVRFYIVTLILIAVSVPVLHLIYMDVELTTVELLVHGASILLSMGITIVLFELLAWYYLWGKVHQWRMSVGVFWSVFLGSFVLMQIVMSATHDVLPITI